MIPRRSRLHGASSFGCVSSACETDVSHGVVCGSNPHPVLVHQTWREKKVQQWRKKAAELDEKGLFVSAGVARGMADYYGREL